MLLNLIIVSCIYDFQVLISFDWFWFLLIIWYPLVLSFGMENTYSNNLLPFWSLQKLSVIDSDSSFFDLSKFYTTVVFGVIKMTPSYFSPFSVSLYNSRDPLE